MKKILSTIIICVAFFSVLKATIHTVNNNTSIPNPGQFTTVNAAVAAASSGDTIYISGSNTLYSGFGITKPLTVIGTGYDPDNEFGLTSSVTGTITFTSTGSNSVLIGVVCTGGLSITNNTTDITIQRCHFSTVGGSSITLAIGNSDIIIQNNLIQGALVLGSTSSTANTNIMISNNVFRTEIMNSNHSSVLITNNIFHSASTGSAFVQIANAIISNNIFYLGKTAGLSTSDCDQCSFAKNAAYPSTNPNFFNYGTNSGDAVYVGVDPQFVNVPVNAILTTHDYTPQAAVLLNGGTDATDVGVTGGLSPFTVANLGNAPIPVINEMLILTPNVATGGNIEINVKAEIQN